MVYILVLFGSFFGICAILGVRVALKNRNVRKFVRGVSRRTEKARERGLTMRETRIEKPKKNPRASAVDMQKLRSLLREVEKVGARKKYDEVERLLIQALTISPESIEARAELAKLYLVMDRDAKAEALYRELLADSNDVSFHSNLALSCYKQGKYEASCVSYQEALNLDPRSPERAAALGRACMAATHYKEAVDLFEKAAERLSRDTELLMMLGESYEKMGDLKGAEDAYYRIHRLQPYNEAIKQKLSTLAGV